MIVSRRALLPGGLLFAATLAATGCSSSGSSRPGPSEERDGKARAPVAVVELLGTRSETDRFVRALLDGSPSRGVPVYIDEVPAGADALVKGERGREPRREPEMARDWKPATLLRVEVKPVTTVEKLERQRPAGEAAERTAASEPLERSWWEASSVVRVELIDPDGRKSRGFIDVRGEARTEPSKGRDAARSEEAAAKALEAAAAQLLERLKARRSPAGGARQ